MTATITGAKLLTADEVFELSEEGIVKGELVKGVLIETMPAGGKHGEIVIALGGEIRAHVRPRRTGRVAGSDTGVRLERNPDTVRDRTLLTFRRKPCPWM